MEIAETTNRHRGLLKVINEVLEALWGSSVNHIVKVVNEVLQSSWVFALKKIIDEGANVAEGQFDAVLRITEILSEAVELVGSVLKYVALKVVWVINESVTVYDSLTRIMARALMGIIQVVNESVGISESLVRLRAWSRFVTRWRHRR